MKSRSALYKLNLSGKYDDFYTGRVEIENVHFHECAIICLNDAQLVLKFNDTRKKNIQPHSICYISKNTIVDIVLYKISKGTPYYIYNIDNEMLNSIYSAMTPLLLISTQNPLKKYKVFSFRADDVDKWIFNLLIKGNIPHHRKIYKVAYLLSKINNIESLMCSLSTARYTTFTEKLTKIIESDISKTWYISDFAKILHMSESLIRKNLEKENIKYNNLIKDIRMSHAFNLIMTTEKHINTISREVGYASTSYFIHNFKKYFGITPKQFSMQVKHAL
ncbi:TPA: helix-turn-helix transcriptional regulator [Escherichia coli]|nr:helix-turn-helix transcriptional regulator [Escherichia coli]HAZ3502868.1 helix-turn-helix transcriptional regulator [Escherichia coli]HAZ3652808.1 helix-turn-helix transcriptional regulator [Escherichia coli]HAZ3671038.1 helix-turn-helix transcriptional regulator [Escherichia coli]